MKVYVKKVEGVVVPTQGSPRSSGYDIVATSDPKIQGKRPTGLGLSESSSAWANIDYIEYETNLFIAPTVQTVHTLIHPRSSVSKYNLQLANSIGLIDNDYRGMVICRFNYLWQPEDYAVISNFLVGTVNMNRIYKKGEKIAQLVFEPTLQVEFELIDELQTTERGAGGFGSTDKKVILTDAPVSKAKFPEPEPSSMAERWRQQAYIQTPEKSYEDVMKETESNQ